MNWELDCPNVHCRCYGKLFEQGLLVKNGTRYGQPQSLCKACGSSVALRTATAYAGLDADPAIVETAVRALAEGNGATYGDAWVGIALAPVWRLVVAFVMGKRTQESANSLLARVAQVTDQHLPFFTSDQLPAYKHSWLHPAGQWYTPARRGRRGVPPKPRRRPPPGLRYAQRVKKREKGRVVAVGTQVVVGDCQAMAACLAGSPVSHTINTSFVERDHLTQQQSNRRLTRRTKSFSKDIWHDRPSLDNDRVAILLRTSRVPGAAARNRTPVPKTGPISSRELRDTTLLEL